MTRDEVKAVLDQLSSDKWLMASLLYGSGLRLMECLQLRVQDLDFAGRELLVRSENPRPLDGVRVLWLCQKGS
jgi:integrase